MRILSKGERDLLPIMQLVLEEEYILLRAYNSMSILSK